MSNYPLMSQSDLDKAPFNEIEEKTVVRKKISVILTKEIEVEVDANREYEDKEILKDYIDKYKSPSVYLKDYQELMEFYKDKAISQGLPLNAYNKDLIGVKGWETEDIEIDDAE